MSTDSTKKKDQKITKKERNDYIRVAKQLYYSDSIIERLMKAKTIHELDRIMVDGRHEKDD